MNVNANNNKIVNLNNIICVCVALEINVCRVYIIVYVIMQKINAKQHNMQRQLMKRKELM